MKFETEENDREICEMHCGKSLQGTGSLEPVFEFFENQHFYVSKNSELKF
jgi:hypothetical protein